MFESLIARIQVEKEFRNANESQKSDTVINEKETSASKLQLEVQSLQEKYGAEIVAERTTYLGEPVYVLKQKCDTNLYLISEGLVASCGNESLANFPTLKYTLGEAIIIEDIQSFNFEKRGYGTVLLDVLVDYALQNNYNKSSFVTGSLSSEDAKSEDKKKSRNQFYWNRGFDIKPNPDAASGYIEAPIEELLTARTWESRERTD